MRALRRDSYAEDSRLKRALAGDPAARSELIAEHYDFARRMLFRLVGPCQDLADLHQQIMLEMLASLHRYDETCALRTWVGAICINVARTYLRRQRRAAQPVSPAELESTLNRSRSQEDDLVARDDLRRSLEALEALNVDQRIAFVLRAAYGYSVAEIAQLTHSAHTTTRLRLYYGRRIFFRTVRRIRRGLHDE